MFTRIGVALAAAMLLLPLTVVAQKGGRSRSSSPRSSSSSTAHKRKSTSIKSGSRRTYRPRKSTVAQRKANGKIRRSAAARSQFMRQTGYPRGRKGYVVDHIVPLECGGADTPSNMQWQTAAGAKIKDRTERNCRRE